MCPRCFQRLVTGVHHRNCAAGNAAPRQAEKLRRIKTKLKRSKEHESEGTSRDDGGSGSWSEGFEQDRNRKALIDDMVNVAIDAVGRWCREEWEAQFQWQRQHAHTSTSTAERMSRSSGRKKKNKRPH